MLKGTALLPSESMRPLPLCFETTKRDYPFHLVGYFFTFELDDKFHPPTPGNHGHKPVEGGKDKANVASADVRPFLDKADEPDKALKPACPASQRRAGRQAKVLERRRVIKTR